MARYVKFFGLGGGTDGFITGSCNDIQTTSYLQANGPEANINVAIIPKGTGAIVAACPDGTPSGGDPRGIYAVDLQIQRGFSYEVASGQSSFTAGFGNRASGSYSIAIGNRNLASGYSSAAIGGGNGGGSGVNAVADYAIAAGGFQNNATSQYSAIFGGSINTASTGSHATVVGGSGNTSSGQYSVAGGSSNVASGQGAIALGRSNTASSTGSIAIGTSNTVTYQLGFAGGNGNTVSVKGTAFGGSNTVAGGEWSAAIGSSNSITSTGNSYVIGDKIGSTATHAFGTGNNSRAYLTGQRVHASGWFVLGNGDQQISDLIASKLDILSSAATTTLTLWDGSLIIPNGNNRLWAVKITATAFVSAVSGTTLVLGDSYMAEYTVLFKRVGGVSSVVGTNAGSVIADTNMISSAFTFAAGASQELAITFKAPTTANADTFRCVAKVELVEVAY